MKKTALLLMAMLGLLLFPPAALAQGGDDGEAKEMGKQLVAGLKDFDAALAGTSWYGIHMAASPKNMGTAKMTVEKSAEAGSVYKVTSEISMRMGPMTFKVLDVSFLDASGSLVRQDTTEDQGEEKKVTTVKREGNKWTAKVVKGGATLTTRHEAAMTSHWELPSQFVLLRKLPLDKPCTYVLPGIDWPEADGEGEAEKALPAENVKELKITVPAAASKFQHRGTEVEAYEIKIERTGKGADVFVVDAKHTLLAILPSDAPIRMYFGTETQAAGDLPVSEADRAREGGVREAVGVYLDVIAGVKEPSALDAVMDWKALRESMGKDSPEMGALNDEAFANLMKEQFKSNANPELKEQIGLLKDMLTVKVDGDSATVLMPGQDENPFHLKKVDGKWKIVRFPM
ncbi:MAG: hypothetical protein MUC63_00410 [Planctomycetes bacterium]|jgi:hypothetical protein|nr:hypothetical protein [Planctomycetota bacterium]